MKSSQWSLVLSQRKQGMALTPCVWLCSHLLFIDTQSHSKTETQAIFTNILQLIHSFIYQGVSRETARQMWVGGCKMDWRSALFCRSSQDPQL